MFDLQSFLSGLALGLAGKPLALAREPVAYLYNGVRLPKLPEWDREMYPYATILYFLVTPQFWVSTMPLEVEYNGNIYNPCASAGTSALQFCTYTGNDTWESFDVAEYPERTVWDGAGIQWANYDVINSTDKSVFLEASEPVPVYE